MYSQIIRFHSSSWLSRIPMCINTTFSLFTAHVGSGSSPHHGVFLPLPLLKAFPLLVAGHVPLLLPYPAGLWGISPPLLQFSGHPALFAMCLFCCYCLLFSFLFPLFSLGGSRSLQGAMLIWPRVVCGSAAYCLAHLVVCIFPSHLGTGVRWRPRSPPGFPV
jgi:hypothetical protein